MEGQRFVLPLVYFVNQHDRGAYKYADHLFVSGLDIGRHGIL